MSEFSSIEIILDSLFGESKNGMSDNTQIQYCCPKCAEDDGVESDGKFNLEINLQRNRFRCWRCEHENDMHGKISNLIRRFGNEGMLLKYREEIKEIKKSKEYEFKFLDNNDPFEEDEELIIELPPQTTDFKFDGNNKEFEALTYLMERGIDEYFIKKFNIKYIGNYCENYNFRNRIIIPSYDKYGNLNYYTGRDYSNKNARKYYNYEKSKRREIIFNELFINWDADIVLVEGPTDHLVVPNSIPLLGKSLNLDYYLFECLIKKSTQNVIVFLDSDAMANAIKICELLSINGLHGRLKIVPTNKMIDMFNCELDENEKVKTLDPSKIYQLGKIKDKGKNKMALSSVANISKALKMAENFLINLYL